MKMHIQLQIFGGKKKKEAAQNAKLVFMRKGNRKAFSNCNE
jgi:hypothetical protein